jgi:hypothetical protein
MGEESRRKRSLQDEKEKEWWIDNRRKRIENYFQLPFKVVKTHLICDSDLQLFHRTNPAI